MYTGLFEQEFVSSPSHNARDALLRKIRDRSKSLGDSNERGCA